MTREIDYEYDENDNNKRDYIDSLEKAIDNLQKEILCLYLENKGLFNEKAELKQSLYDALNREEHLKIRLRDIYGNIGAIS